jgi:hypothetical protein
MYFGEPDSIPSSVPPMLQGNWRIPDANGSVIPHSELYWVDKNNPQGPAPMLSAQDAQLPYWEYAINTWYNTHPELFMGSQMLPVPLSDISPSTTSTP